MSRTVSHPAFPTRSQQDARLMGAGVLRGPGLARRVNVPAATPSTVRALVPLASVWRTPSGCRQTLALTPTRAPLMAAPLLRG